MSSSTTEGIYESERKARYMLHVCIMYQKGLAIVWVMKEE